MRFLTKVILLLALACPAFAGDYSSVEVVGFSPDGAYFCFEQYGHYDGSGFPYSEHFFIDVANNLWASKSIEVCHETEDIDLDDTRLGCFSRSMPTMRKLGLDRAVPGKKAFENLNSYDEAPRTSYELESHNGVFKISTTPAEADPDMAMFGTPELLKLTYVNIDSGEEVVLQLDARLPKSRQGAMNYSIKAVYVTEDGVAAVVIVGYDTPGFEGPNKRFIAVSGVIRI